MGFLDPSSLRNNIWMVLWKTIQRNEILDLLPLKRYVISEYSFI